MSESSVQKLLSPAWGHLNKSPIVRGEGVYVYDATGKRFIDFTSGIGVTATGHCHPAVVNAIQQQAEQLVFGQINCMIPEPTLLIVDEIQSGFGRTGDFWAHTSSGVTPDILLIAKAIASGLPLSAIAATRELMEHFPTGSHGGTYGGGSAIAMQAAQATLHVIKQESLISNSRRVGSHLLQRLSASQERFSVLADVRGRGLMVACEFVDQGHPATELVKTVQQKCLAAGLMLLSCGTYSNVIRWLPPLVVTAEQIDEAVKIFESAL